MKKVIFFVNVLLISVMGLYAQDTIVFRNGDEIRAKVTEVNVDDIKYKLWSNQDGPTYTKRLSDIFMIKYSDGHKELFNQKSVYSSAQNEEINRKNLAESEKKSQKEEDRKKYGSRFFMEIAGYGEGCFANYVRQMTDGEGNNRGTFRPYELGGGGEITLGGYVNSSRSVVVGGKIKQGGMQADLYGKQIFFDGSGYSMYDKQNYYVGTIMVDARYFYYFGPKNNMAVSIEGGIGLAFRKEMMKGYNGTTKLEEGFTLEIMPSFAYWFNEKRKNGIDVGIGYSYYNFEKVSNTYYYTTVIKYGMKLNGFRVKVGWLF